MDNMHDMNRLQDLAPIRRPLGRDRMLVFYPSNLPKADIITDRLENAARRTHPLITQACPVRR